ncbi:MAG: hypothetical protein E7065_08075, partial [Lentimicrobiaceae bacterium]|nr:hypothetical protein [Lentimicrobiaceae bacterium]
MKKFIVLSILNILLCRISTTFSQEWQFSIESDTLEGYGFTSNVTELSNGNLLMPCNHAFRYNPHEHATICPSIILLSKDGKELARNDFFRPGYCLMSHGQAFEKNNSLYYLTTYTPEHTQNCFNNHFENSDNPPSDGKLVLMKLDDQLNMEECYEHSWPVDT